jgi:hypothetical protein
MARHLTYANVVATLALFIALGGGAYAVTALPKNSVTTFQVKNGSLLAKDFKKGQLKRGARGLQGLPGLKGDQGPQGTKGDKGDAGVNGINGTNGTNGLDGSAKAYAYVSGPGTGVDETRSKNIIDANITKGVSNGEYCIDGLPFTPSNAQVTPDMLSSMNAIGAEVEVPSNGSGSCPNAQVYVLIKSVAANFTTKTLTFPNVNNGFYIEIN